MRQFGVRSIAWALVLCSLYEDAVEAFQLSSPNFRGIAHLKASSLSKNNKARSSSSLGAEAINKETSQVSGGLMSIGSALQSQLVSAFTALDESDQYDAVLTGLCAKILDDPSKSGDQVTVALQDLIQLLQEMNSRRIPASGRSLMALIDATVTSEDAKIMSQIISLAVKNGGISQYGSFQVDITPMPTAPTSRVKCPDGSTKTRAERLRSLPDIPTDNRSTEVTNALAVGSLIAFCGAVDVLGLEDISPFTNTVWALLVVVGVTDNFWDMIKFGLKTAAKDKGTKIPEKLPFGIGSGKVSGTVVKGFNRLLQVDTERECQCEAAAFFAAYSLGLPVFSFQPNALEAAVLVAESTRKENNMDTLLTNNGIMKMLVWLMAPAAMESAKHPQLILSDPREAAGLLTRLEKSALIDKNELWWTYEPEERLDLLKWAYTEADLLLRRNQKAVSEVSDRLTGGAATVGDCVAAIEGW